jgi:hypothetical protein
MTRDTRDTTPAGNIFPDFLKRDPITDRSAAAIPGTREENDVK